MVRHKSAEKRHRESLKAQTRNRWWKSRVRTASKKVVEAVTKKDKDSASKALSFATKEIYKARGKGALHRNTAARRVGRLSKLVSSL
ncbi:MAG: 30S ribosomal protein S20 [Pseudomonadota bacterium]|jgi:small subunit ribosomal protein S20